MNSQKKKKIDWSAREKELKSIAEWAKQALLGLEKDVYLVFETPKKGNGLGNDVRNMNYYKLLK